MTCPWKGGLSLVFLFTCPQYMWTALLHWHILGTTCMALNYNRSLSSNLIFFSSLLLHIYNTMAIHVVDTKHYPYVISFSGYKAVFSIRLLSWVWAGILHQLNILPHHGPLGVEALAEESELCIHMIWVSPLVGKASQREMVTLYLYD